MGCRRRILSPAWPEIKQEARIRRSQCGAWISLRHCRSYISCKCWLYTFFAANQDTESRKFISRDNLGALPEPDIYRRIRDSRMMLKSRLKINSQIQLRIYLLVNKLHCFSAHSRSANFRSTRCNSPTNTGAASLKGFCSPFFFKHDGVRPHSRYENRIVSDCGDIAILSRSNVR